MFIKKIGSYIFNVKYKNGYIRYKLFGLVIFKIKNFVTNFFLSYRKNKSFDTRNFDKQISEYAYENFNVSSINQINQNNIAIMATEFYKTGGHTKCALHFVKAIYDTYKIKIFLTKKSSSHLGTINELCNYADVEGEDFTELNYASLIESYYENIVRFSPKVIFVYMNMDDIFSAMVLALIKKNTNIKIIYFNHGSHFPALGFSFADLVLEGMPTTQYVTTNFRKINKCYIIGLLCEKKDNITYYDTDLILQKRKELGINKDEILIMSGGSGYKYFNKNNSEHFKMIKSLLEIEPKLKYAVITDLTKSQKKTVDDIFKNTKSKEQFIVIPQTPAYQLLFQSCDVFIDSFPVSSALTQIDLMKFKIPTVVKINISNSLLSFHEYMPTNYPYMFENIEDMKNGILKLVKDKKEQAKIIELNYNHYLNTFEGDVVKQKYINIIENLDKIEQFYQKLDTELAYNFQDI